MKTKNNEIKPQTPQSTATVNRDQITQRARQIWEQEGRPEGRAEVHWLMAEAQLRDAMKQRARI
jgi:hypothetical protein